MVVRGQLNRYVTAAAAVVLALAIAGCGGSSSTSATGEETAAGLIPASVALYVSVNTDLESEQWDRLDALLDEFPGRDRLLGLIRGGLADEGVDYERDVEPALGPTVEIAVLDLRAGEATVVALTKPKDKAKFDALLKKGDDDELVSQEIDGWTAVSDSREALSRFDAARSGEKLADFKPFEEAMADLPEEAVVKLYGNGPVLLEALESLPGLGGAPLPQGQKLESLAAAVEAEDDGVRLLFDGRGEGIELPDVGDLGEDVPSGAIAFANFGLGDQTDELQKQLDRPELRPLLRQFESAAGVTVADILQLFREEVVLYVRPAAVIPEVTLVAKADEAQAKRTLDRLAQALGGLAGAATRPLRIGDVDATELDLESFSIFYATLDGKVVVTSLQDGIRDLREDGDRIGDDDRYKEALEAADVGDDENVGLYVDLREAVGLVERLAQLAGERLPNDVSANLAPLDSLVVTSESDGDRFRARVFVKID